MTQHGTGKDFRQAVSLRRMQGCAGRLIERATWPILVVWVAFGPEPAATLWRRATPLTPHGAESMTEPREKLVESTDVVYDEAPFERGVVM